MSNASESQLLQRAQGGDQAAFSAVCAQHVDAVYDFCLTLLDDAGMAGVAASPAFGDAATRIAAFSRSASPLAWLLGAARRQCAGAGVPEPAHNATRNPDPELEASTEDAELLAAARALGLERHALLDLKLRRRLTPAQFAIAAGISGANADILGRRLEQSTTDDLRAGFLAARCPSLATILSRAARPQIRRRARELATHHVARCGRCVRANAALGDPLTRYAALAGETAPPATRAMVLRSVLSHWPASKGQPSHAALRVQAAPARLSRGRVILVIAPLAAACGALTSLLILPESPLAITRDREPAVQSRNLVIDLPPATTPPSAGSTPSRGVGGLATDTPTPTATTPPATAIAPFTVTSVPSAQPPTLVPSPTPTRTATPTATLAPPTPTATAATPTATAVPTQAATTATA
ncbi:MAG: RNA polymerase sigma factor, partial [Hyphomicrobiaceae bacterium]